MLAKLKDFTVQADAYNDSATMFVATLAALDQRREELIAAGKALGITLPKVRAMLWHVTVKITGPMPPLKFDDDAIDAERGIDASNESIAVPSLDAPAPPPAADVNIDIPHDLRRAP